MTYYELTESTASLAAVEFYRAQVESTHPSIIDRLSSALEKMKPTLGDFDRSTAYQNPKNS